MRKIAWVTDSTSTIDSAFAEEHDIYVVPLRVVFGENSYKEMTEITVEQFYERLSLSGKASSSQPPVGEFLQLYERLKEHYDDVIAIHCSSQLSGTLHTSIQAAEMAGVEIVAIDSKAGAFPLREMILRGIQWQKEGATPQQIKQKILLLIEKMSFYLLPTSLAQLHRSGRVSGTKLLISQLLKMHLLLRFEEGKVVVFDKIRTLNKAKQRMLDLLGQDYNKVRQVCIMHANDYEKAKLLQQHINNTMPKLSTEIMSFIPVVGVHAGEGTLGLCWFTN